MNENTNNKRESFKFRQLKYGGYATLITIAVIAALILLNLIAGQFPMQLDLTSTKLFSLSEQTLQVLDSIKAPVKFYGLWRPGEEDKNLVDVINLYLAKNKNIGFEIIDPDRNPGFLLRYDKENTGIPRGSLIVEGEKAFRVIAPYEMYDVNQTQSGGSSVTGIAMERRITGALLFAGTGTTPAVYEITGHAEIPLSAIGFKDIIERENFSLRTLNLLLTTVPSDASALILNSPSGDLTGEEAEKILDYLSEGGRFMVLADYNIRELFNLNEVLASYGLKFEYGIVHETDPYYVAIDPRTEWPDMADHEITAPLGDKTRTPVVLLEAMPLSLLETKRRSVEVTPLMTSSSAAFLRADLDNNSAVALPSDIPGPLILGAAVTDPSWVEEGQAQARLVAIGAGSFLPLAVQGFDANRDFFMNSLTWLQDRPETISVRSKSLFLMPMRFNVVQVFIFGALFIFVFPMFFFVSGFVIWLKRRHL